MCCERIQARRPDRDHFVESRYRALVGALTQIVLVLDEEGKVVEAQPRWTAYTGQADTECAGLGWWDAVHPDDRAALTQVWSGGVSASERFEVEFRVHHGPSDEYRHCEGPVVPLHDDNGVLREWVMALTDVHERYLFEERRRAGAERLQRLIDSNVVAVCYGVDDLIIDGNRAFFDIVRARHGDLRGGLPVQDLVSAETASRTVAAFGTGDAVEHEIRRMDGTTGFVLTAGSPLAPDPGWLAVVVDITERKLAEESAQRLALHDPLTGLPNRRLLADRLDQSLVRAVRPGAVVAVAFCDLDDFKAVNDNYGHATGDLVLLEIGLRLESLSRGADTVARVGGDEFVIVLEDLARPDDALPIAERIRAAIAQPIPGTSAMVTASIGLAFSAGGEYDRESLLARADEAMYRAKRAGRNRVATGGSADLSSLLDRRRIERELSKALNENTLDLAFQPVIDLRSQRPVGAEALLRWTVDGQPVSTAHAIEVAEATGVITRVSDWIISNACRHFDDWRSCHPATDDWTLHLNISARDLANDRCVYRILKSVPEGCRPSDVCLEITETALLQDPKPASVHLAELRSHGFGIAIDDFGTGYASLSILRELPADIVKIDRCFVSGLGGSDRDRAIVRHTIEMAHDLEMVVVAEGVETQVQLDVLLEVGCDQAQGYLFARPRPIEELCADLPPFAANRSIQR